MFKKETLHLLHKYLVVKLDDVASAFFLTVGRKEHVAVDGVNRLLRIEVTGMGQSTIPVRNITKSGHDSVAVHLRNTVHATHDDLVEVAADQEPPPVR